jgi:hypothetical protein
MVQPYVLLFANIIDVMHIEYFYHMCNYPPKKTGMIKMTGRSVPEIQNVRDTFT